MSIAILAIATFIVVSIAVLAHYQHRRQSAPMIVNALTRTELDALVERNWRSIPAAQREMCIEHLKAQIPDHVWRIWRSDGFPELFHMYHGMGVRNLLRDVLTDDKLPGDKNWDDYYMGCLHEIIERME
jgi:hypothetical protein